MKILLLAAMGFLASVGAVQAQGQLTSADIQRLQDSVFDASADLSRLRGRDTRLAATLERDLDELRDEVIYLKVKLRKESQVSRAEYADVRDRIDRLRSEARGDAAPAAAAPRPTVSDRRISATEIPVGTE